MEKLKRREVDEVKKEKADEFAEAARRAAANINTNAPAKRTKEVTPEDIKKAIDNINANVKKK